MITVRPGPAPLTRSASGSRLRRTGLWLSGLVSAGELQALEQAVSSTRSFTANTDLVREGSGTESIFIITNGWACRYATTRAGGRQVSAVLVPGDVANLDSLMFDQLDYCVRSLTQIETVVLHRSRVLTLAGLHPGIAHALIQVGLVENAILSRWTLSLGCRSAVEALAHLLCEFSVRLDVEQENASSFALPMTQEQLSDVLGLTSVHVNRMMQLLRAEGLVVTDGRTITVPDVERLRRVGGFEPRYLHRTSRAEVCQA